MKGKLIIICAPSGAGKTTIIKHLLPKKLDLEFSVSATSRDKRHNETHGVDYYFFNSEDFKYKIQNNEFIEWEEVYSGVYYGTLKSEVDRIINNQKNVIFDVDVYGAVNIKKLFPENSLLIFIKPPSIDVLRERLVSRSTDTMKTIEQRIDKAAEEINYYVSNIKYFNHTIVNDDLQNAKDQSYNTILQFIKS